MHHALTAIVVLFGAALVVAWLMRLMRLPTILGFLLAGILIGPSGLHLIHEGEEQHQIEFFAELGLVMLLFTVGLELSPAPLLRMGPRLLVASGVQIGATLLLGAVAVAAALGMKWSSAGLVGAGLALSSTAIVLKHFSERGLIDTPDGRITTGILLVQDVAVIMLLVLLPLVARGGAGPLAVAAKIGGALVGLAAAILLARWLMPRIVNIVFRYGGQELMTLFAILMACLGAWLAGLANWSWALGAFIAGLLLAQSDLRHQIEAEITPFRDAFNALFFISIGMLVPLEVVWENAAGLSVAIVGTLVLKALLAGAGVLAGGWPLRLGLSVGLGLCTVSEFGYVLIKEASSERLGLVPADFMPLFVAWAVGTMLLGALLMPVAQPIAAALTRRWGREEAPAAAEVHGDEAHPHLTSHVIIVGYGINGRNLATVLRAVRIPHHVIEMNRSSAQRARKDGVPVVVGDATRLAILRSVGLHAARALVVAIADPWATRRIVANAHQVRPDLYILARTRFVAELEPLYREGAAQVIPEEFETSIEMFAHVLKEFAIPDNVIEQQVALIRAGHYGMLRGRTGHRTVHTEWLRLLEVAVTQTHLLLEGSPAAGRTIREFDLRAKTGATIVAITREGRPIANPDPNVQLLAGDVLVLVGTHHQLDRTRALLAPPE